MRETKIKTTIILHHKAAEMSPVPVEAVHHFEVHPQVLLGEVVQHARIHQALHEVAAVLR